MIYDTQLQGLLAKASKVYYESATIMYIGYAYGNVADSDNAWAICKVVDSDANPNTYPRTKSITWAKGRYPDQVRNLRLDLRATYSYEY